MFGISFFGFSRLKCIIKQLLDSVLLICKIINVSVTVISLAFGSADNSCLDIDNSAYHKNLKVVTIGPKEGALEKNFRNFYPDLKNFFLMKENSLINNTLIVVIVKVQS